MPFSISGRIAGGMDEALEQVLDRRLKEAVRQDQERQRTAENLMRQQGIDLQREGVGLQRETMAQNAANQKEDNARELRRVALEELRNTQQQTEKTTQANRASDMAGVLAMPGMANEDKMRELSGLAVRSGADPLKIIENLKPVAPPKKNLHTVGRSLVDEEGNVLFTAPRDAPQGGAESYEWVTGSDGKPRQIIKGTAGPGDRPYDATFERGKARTATVHPQLIKYSENLIRKIDDLVGREDDPDTPDVNEARPNRITKYTAGGGGTVMRNIPLVNTEAKNVDAELFSLTSELAIAALQKMRASSMTGGAVGNVALGEMEIMKNAEAAMAKDQSPENLRRQLGIIRDSERKFLEAVQQDQKEHNQQDPDLNKGYTLKPGTLPGAGGPKKFTIIGSQ